MRTSIARRLVLALTLLLAPPVVAFAAEGDMRWELHVTLALNWLEPAETEAFDTASMVLDAEKREALVHQGQRRVHDQVVNIPVCDLASTRGVGSRVEESGGRLVPVIAYSAPFEDLRLKK